MILGAYDSEGMMNLAILPVLKPGCHGYFMLVDIMSLALIVKQQ